MHLVTRYLNLSAMEITEKRDWDHFISGLAYYLGYRERYLDTPTFILYGPLLNKPWEDYNEAEKSGLYLEDELDPFAYIWLHTWNKGFIVYEIAEKLVDRFAPIIIEMTDRLYDNLLLTWEADMLVKLKFFYMDIYDAVAAKESLSFGAV